MPLEVEVPLDGEADVAGVVVVVGLIALLVASFTALLAVGVTVGTAVSEKEKLFADDDEVVEGSVAGTAPELPVRPSQRPWQPVVVLVVAPLGSRPFTVELALVAVLVVVVPAVVVPVVVVPVVVVPVVVVPVVVVPVVVVPVVVVPVVVVPVVVVAVVVVSVITGATLSPAPSAADAFEDVEVVVGVVAVMIVVVVAGVVEVVAVEVAIGAAVTAVDTAAVWAACVLGRIASTSCSGERWSSESPASLASIRASRT